jgi:hypothetical protein
MATANVENPNVLFVAGFNSAGPLSKNSWQAVDIRNQFRRASTWNSPIGQSKLANCRGGKSK